MSIKTVITADSTCDLPDKLCERYGIHKIGICVEYDNKTVVDDGSIDCSVMFEYTERTGLLPKTAARSIAEYSEEFNKFTSQGFQVLHISMSSGISSSYQNAVIAASELDGVYVVDSFQLSSGQGILAILCAEQALNGKSAENILAYANVIKNNIRTSFVVNSLDYLAKGGRCSSVAAFGANVLKIKPSIVMTNGNLMVSKKYRGKLEACLDQYVRDTLAQYSEFDLSRVFITFPIMTDPDIPQRIKDLVLSIVPFNEVIINKAGITIGAHCGADTLGILFVAT